MADTVVTCVAYNLSVTDNSEITDFVLTVLGDDDKQYHLHDHGTKKQTPLVRKVLYAIAGAWPDVTFQVQADGSRTITGVP